jgi:hypothetical protein
VWWFSRAVAAAAALLPALLGAPMLLRLVVAHNGRA